MDKLFTIQLDAHKVPEFKEDRSKDWVLYGSSRPYRNRYPDYLLDLFNASAKHHAIVLGKTDYIVGKGFNVKTEGLNTVNLAALNQFLAEPNKDESLNEIMAKCALDLEIFNGFALEIIYNQTNKKIAAIHHAEFSKYRKSKNGDFYYYSEDWKPHKPKTEVIGAFDFENPQGRQLLYVKAYHPGGVVYPLPGYLGSVPYIEIDKEIANFHLNSIKNGFMGGTMVNFFNGQPTPEEQRAIEDKLYSKFSGSDNANKIVLNFNDSREQGAEIIPLHGNDFEERFQVLNDTVQMEIFAGHRIVDPNLFGIKEEGIFANRQQLRDSYELFQNTYVNGRQMLLEQVFNGLASIQGFEGRLEIQDTEPIGVSFSEATRVNVMTTDEIRAEIGLEPLTEQVQEEMSKEEDEGELRLCEAFKDCGLSLDEWEVVEGKEVRFNSDRELELSEERITRYGFGTEAFNMTVLELLSKDPTLTWAAIAAQLETTLDEVLTAVRELSSANMLTIGTESIVDTPQRSVEVTPQGTKALETAEPLEVGLKIAYRYVKSGEASGPSVLKTTRDFCRDMVDQSERRVWTSKEIANIGIREDRNVWLRRGGFWTRKGTDVTTPYCRHVWEQVIIKEK